MTPVTSPAGGIDGRVVIVGAGIIGVSIAYHLAARGHSDVLVLDRGAIGEGTTARATGGIRAQFTSAVNASLVHHSVPEFLRLAEMTGEPFEFRQHGYLFLLNQPGQHEAFGRAVRMQQRLGIPSQLLGPDEVSVLYPQLRTDDLLGGTYCPADGSGSPTDATNAYAKAARRAGVRITTHREVVGFERRADGRVCGVRTADGAVEEAAVVVLAAGALSAELGHTAGVDLAVTPHRRQAFVIDAPSWLDRDRPFTVDLSSGAYLHPEIGSAVIGGNDRDVPAGTDTTVDETLRPSLLSALVARWPLLESARVRRGWAGLREMTPDDHALVGPLRDVPGLWVACGFSGHGFMQAPAIGDTLAQLLTTGVSDIDIGMLRAERFADGQSIVEDGVF
jgi:sarcosine oxidase subunit beta